ncbi:HD domain-containing protein [Prosthecochloris sp. N3]|uniref:HD domain-containing protein n=1 Tax=Prosthecochloris ethylica TaxID=2743976 RepID=A0ABR9XP97_9CHLB|nr:MULTISPECIES: Pycsar system effector family protein [Prosthecochloris]MBF0586150.1 HD domain-containing protein [Prosthecochloris ethylica]MBF0635856.1 HD domain-containing protein [Prosthecochloris ethylica]NUK47469.1 HD domain-containing protein [Prosthecochloris ethylica]RNA65015.1 HD domain-containing protein [Prosthecochloris sp. ZM_2]
MTHNTSLLEQTAAYVFALFQQHPGESGYYHNYNHTRETVEAARQICQGMNLTDDERNIVLLACWFHDTGFLNAPDNHEQASAKIAEEFLAGHGVGKAAIDAVKRCILATRMPQQPGSVLEEIVCDADLAHLGSENYFRKNELIRIELEQKEQQTFSEQQWLEINIDFFRKHHFFTPYAAEHYKEQKEQNIIQLYEQLKKKKKKEEKKNKDRESKQTSRGVERNMEVYYRTSSRNHVSFSANVDQKANIMIQTNSLIFSIIISLLVRKLDQLPDLIIPTFVTLSTCVATIITSVLATRPKVTRHETTIPDIKERKANLLFFGSFVNLDLEEYEWGVKEMLKDKPYYIANMIRDTYFLGKVLDKKYRYLRLSYDIFMYGLITSIVLYGYAFTR